MITLRTFHEAYTAWKEDDAPRLGAALSYYMLFSIAPFLLVVFAVIDLLYQSDTIRPSLYGELYYFLGAEGTRLIQDVLAQATRPQTSHIALFAGGIVILLGAIGVFRELQVTVNHLWHVPNYHRSFLHTIQRNFFAFLFVIVTGVTLLGSLFLSTALLRFSGAIAHFFGLPLFFLNAVHALLLFIGTIFFFGTLFKVLPDTSVPWKRVWFPALVTSVLFAIGKYLFGLYLAYSSLSSSYGAAGSLVIFLVWIYYAAQIFLYGVELTKVTVTSRD